MTGEPDYRLRHASPGKLGATLDPGAWVGAQIVSGGLGAEIE
jgi:hypothetical protein